MMSKKQMDTKNVSETRPGKTQDDRFKFLLHKKIMHKKGPAKRRAKKYYKDQYRKTGIIPKPLLLAEKGIMEGRKCSGRHRSLSDEIKQRFVEMVKASCDLEDLRFIFMTQKTRTVKNYHSFLEAELNKRISLAALRRCVHRENLKLWLKKPDFEESLKGKGSFRPRAVFDLIQVDGCQFRYFKVRNNEGHWQKPNVIEFFDTGSRYIFVLDAYFSESSENAVILFTCFLLCTSFPQKKIQIRPDNAKGFLNLKRAFNALNQEYSVPEGFYMEADFTRFRTPKDKAHLESSHRSLHNFEIQIIKHFENRIAGTEPGYLFRQGKKDKITVTLLDISLDELRSASVLSTYRDNHNHGRHFFSEGGHVKNWIPEERFASFMTSENNPLTFSESQVKGFMKYGFRKKKATVSKTGHIRFNNREYYVSIGADKFTTHKSTPVHLSACGEKLYLFEPKDDGVLLGEALVVKPMDISLKVKPVKQDENELDKLLTFLEARNMVIDTTVLIDIYHQGLTLKAATAVYDKNFPRYTAYEKKMRQPATRKGEALFNAFILDCQHSLMTNHVPSYATHGDL